MLQLRLAILSFLLSYHPNELFFVCTHFDASTSKRCYNLILFWCNFTSLASYFMSIVMLLKSPKWFLMQELWFCSTFLSGHCQVRLAWVLVVWVISLAWNLIQIPWKTLLNGKFSLVTFSALHSLFLSLSHEIRIKKIRILEVLEPLQCEGETGHLLV